MGPEHLEKMEDFNPSSNLEHTWNNLESERPGNVELPYIKQNESGVRDFSELKGRESERERIELPGFEKYASKADSVKKFDTMEQQDIKNPYYSTHEERLQHTPKEISDRGEWQGERGESKYIPNNSEVKDILENYKVDGITYKDAIPDFSDISESTVKIDRMTEIRPDNFKQCDGKCAEQWNKQGHDNRTDWSARDVYNWRKENGYTWHERNDMKTCDLVPTKVHESCGHLGGVSECKKRDAVDFGGDFDE